MAGDGKTMDDVVKDMDAEQAKAEGIKARMAVEGTHTLGHKMFTFVTLDEQQAFFRRAKSEGLADARGIVDIDSVLRGLIVSYGDGDYTILKRTRSAKKVTENHYLKDHKV